MSGLTVVVVRGGLSLPRNVVRVQFDAAYLLKNAELKKIQPGFEYSATTKKKKKKDVKNQESNVFGESDGFSLAALTPPPPLPPSSLS